MILVGIMPTRPLHILPGNSGRMQALSSASHNPVICGIKFSGDGYKLCDEVENEIEES